MDKTFERDLDMLIRDPELGGRGYSSEPADFDAHQRPQAVSNGALQSAVTSSHAQSGSAKNPIDLDSDSDVVFMGTQKVSDAALRERALIKEIRTLKATGNMLRGTSDHNEAIAQTARTRIAAILKDSSLKGANRKEAEHILKELEDQSKVYGPQAKHSVFDKNA